MAGTGATIPRRTLMGSKATTPATNGSGARKCQSWIDRFAESTTNLEAPAIFRKWAGITTLASVLEQKVWLLTSSPVYPNLYVFLVGHPASGKTRSIRAAAAYTNEIADFHRAPISMTFASLVDALVRSKRMIPFYKKEDGSQIEYNTMSIAADELGTFIHKYDKEMADGLSAFYDPVPYGHERRGGDIKIKIKSPQINIIAGSTPSNLMDVIPEGAWGQGLMSRVIMVYSHEKIIGDDFEIVTRALSTELVHDLKVINSLVGEFAIADDYRAAVNGWRALGEPPQVKHPKLLHYNSRRKVHLYKLSMIAALDKSNTLTLTKAHFDQAYNWLCEAELYMPEIFQAGATGADGKVMEEIYHLIQISDLNQSGISEHKLVKWVGERIPAHSVMRLIDIMVASGDIKVTSSDPKTGLRNYSVLPR